MKSKTCKNCKYRDQYTACCNPNLKEADEPELGTLEGDKLVYPYNEGGAFYVGPDFGCVHFERTIK
jgi:hypothetical protein